LGKELPKRGKKNRIWVPPLPGVNKSKSGDTMDQQRKHAILFAATLLCARKLTPMMEDNPDTSKEFLTEHYRWRAIEQAHRLLKMIDKRSASRSFSSQIYSNDP
jgi:hypothetical protein